MQKQVLVCRENFELWSSGCRPCNDKISSISRRWIFERILIRFVFSVRAQHGFNILDIKRGKLRRYLTLHYCWLIQFFILIENKLLYAYKINNKQLIKYSAGHRYMFEFSIFILSLSCQHAVYLTNSRTEKSTERKTKWANYSIRSVNMLPHNGNPLANCKHYRLKEWKIFEMEKFRNDKSWLRQSCQTWKPEHQQMPVPCVKLWSKNKNVINLIKNKTFTFTFTFICWIELVIPITDYNEFSLEFFF